jgi:hypothetical protein
VNAVAKVILVVGFLITFGAGMVVGWQYRGHEVLAAPATTTRPTSRSGFLEAELNLSAEQREQMKKIWSETAHRGGREQEDRRRQFRKERDEAIAALIRPEDRAKYDTVLKTYSDKSSAMEREWRGNYERAVERTKEILNPEQRKKYEEILKKQENRRAEERATSRPGTGKPS